MSCTVEIIITCDGAGPRCHGNDTSADMRHLTAALQRAQRPLTRCQAGCDGECWDKRCPQMRDGEPEKTGRFCPLPPSGLVALRELGE